MGGDDQLSLSELEVLTRAAMAARGYPGRCEVNGHVVDLYADGARLLPPHTPAGRAIRLAAGAAVFNLRCAAAWLGLECWFGLAPYPDEPELLARLVLEPSPVVDHHLCELYEQVAGRFAVGATRRVAVPAETRIDLVRAAAAERAELAWLTGPAAARTLEVVVEAEQRAARPWDRLRPASRFGRRPVLAVLSTGADTEADQLTAGMAAQRLLLTAIRHGFTTSPLDQALTYDDLRAKVRAVTGRPGSPAALLRFLPVVSLPGRRAEMVADHPVSHRPVERTNR